MLTRLRLKNFKLLPDADIELGDRVVLIGPNNSGKTSALQALSLWHFGARRWLEKRAGKKTAPEKRPGVLISRRDLSAIAIPTLDQLWHQRRLRKVLRIAKTPHTSNIPIELTVEGVHGEVPWVCGLEFDFRDEQSIYVRPLQRENGDRMPVPPESALCEVVMLPPMSGLAANELRLDRGAIDTRIGEGRTAEVLRNLCYLVQSESNEAWLSVVTRIRELFGVHLDTPEYVSQRGEIELAYKGRDGIRLDISAAGRGLQQVLLLLAYMQVHPRSILLLDEPDAHLEIVRQREIYAVLSEYAAINGNQIISASHSEVVLEEAAGRDIVIAFLGTPHRINDHTSEVRKSLADIKFSDYYQAIEKGIALYLEGSTDLSILQKIAQKLKHSVSKYLARPFVQYAANHPNDVKKNFFGLREAKPDLVGYALFDRLTLTSAQDPQLTMRTLSKREIENYFCTPEILQAWAAKKGNAVSGGPLLASAWTEAMRESVAEVSSALQTLGQNPWGPDIKASDEVLGPIFTNFFKRLGIENLMRKSNYHELADVIDVAAIDPELVHVLDEIHELSSQAAERNASFNGTGS